MKTDLGQGHLIIGVLAVASALFLIVTWATLPARKAVDAKIAPVELRWQR